MRGTSAIVPGYSLSDISVSMALRILCSNIGPIIAGSVKIDNIFGALFRYIFYNIVHQTAVRINYRDAVPVSYVLNRHIGKKHGFSDTGGADNIHMALAVLWFKPYDRGGSAITVFPEHDPFLRKIGRR